MSKFEFILEEAIYSNASDIRISCTCDIYDKRVFDELYEKIDDVLKELKANYGELR